MTAFQKPNLRKPSTKQTPACVLFTGSKKIMAEKKRKVLFIDNFDSFTYNLVDDFCKRDCNAKVYRADTKIDELKRVVDEFVPDLIVISPGPGTPDTAGVSLAAIDYFKDKLPIFGVCLGHQAIAQNLGGKSVQASPP